MSIAVREIEWAAGFLEGEGSFIDYKSSPRVSAGQVQKWPLDRIAAILGGRVYFYDKKSGPVNQWAIGGAKAVGVMMTLYSLLSPRRQEQIRIALKQWRARRPYASYRRACPRGHEYVTVQERDRTRRRCLVCPKLLRVAG